MIPVRPAPTPSRRNLISGAATALCCASPAAASATEDDVELLAIGRKLDVVLPELMRRAALQSARMEAAQLAATKDLRWPTSDRDHQLVLLGLYETLKGVDGADVDLDALGHQVGELRRRSEQLRATTLAGLRTKARLLAYSHGPIGEDDAELASLLRDLGVVRQP